MTELHLWAVVAVLIVLVLRSLGEAHLSRTELALISAAFAATLVQPVVQQQIGLDASLLAPVCMAVPVIAGGLGGVRGGLLVGALAGAQMALLSEIVPISEAVAGLSRSATHGVSAAVAAATLDAVDRMQTAHQGILFVVVSSTVGAAAGLLTHRGAWCSLAALAWFLFPAFRDARLLFVPSIAGGVVASAGIAMASVTWLRGRTSIS